MIPYAPGPLHRWELQSVEDRFNIETDVVMDTCDWKNRKNSLFSDLLTEIQEEENND